MLLQRITKKPHPLKSRPDINKTINHMKRQETISNHDLAEENEKEQIREYFKNKKNGICVEVGSNEPVSIFSQSWHLEDKLNWRCVLIEPNPDLAAKR